MYIEFSFLIRTAKRRRIADAVDTWSNLDEKLYSRTSTSSKLFARDSVQLTDQLYRYVEFYKGRKDVQSNTEKKKSSFHITFSLLHNQENPILHTICSTRMNTRFLLKFNLKQICFGHGSTFQTL